MPMAIPSPPSSSSTWPPQPLSLNPFPNVNTTGYGNRANFSEPHFAPENIIMLTDGFYTSIYSIFAESMKTYGNVTSFVFEGRP